MKLPLKEPLSARYLYLSPDNTLHVFMPVVSGTTIGLDNTCKAVYALQEFFDKGTNSNKKASLKGELLAYKEALEHDIGLLAADSELTLQKKERLNQIEAYLKVLGVVGKHAELNCLNTGFPSYPRPLEGMMQDRATSNMYSMVLRPSVQDGYLRTEGCKPVFSVAHKSVARNIDQAESPLQQALIQAYSRLRFAARDMKAAVVGEVIKQFNALKEPRPVLNTLIGLLTDEVKKHLHVSIDFGKTAKGQTINQAFFAEVMLFEEQDTTPEQYLETLLAECAKDLFVDSVVSPFNYLTTAEDWSVATQFLLGLTNVYAVAKGKTSQDTNFGAILDASPDLSTQLVETIAQAQQAQDNIEGVVLSWINAHAAELKLKARFTPDEMAAIRRDFAIRYNQIKKSPHFDEFLLLDTQKEGAFVMHQGSICVSFAEFVSSHLLDVPQELTQPLEQARSQSPKLGINIPHKNTLVNNEVEINTATLDKAGLQALFERIDSYQDPKLKEQLFAQLKAERPEFKPQINAKQFLQCVAYGQQKEAESLLKKDPALAQELLTARDMEFTDYSGRTFKCSAYEYAWWAKDSHMRFMLEKYMDDTTKQTLLKRVEDIDGFKSTGEFFKQPRGLVYTQNGKKHHSNHFDLTPLKSALRAYIEAYNQSPKQSDADWEALNTVWIKVGLPQREVPAHIAHEYCHPKRSFNDVVKNPTLLDAAIHANLERVLTFHNYETDSDDAWFTPTPSDGDSGLGVSFAVAGRGWAVGPSFAGWGPFAVDWEHATIDLSAIEAIDKARTEDLKRSLANLAAPSILQAQRPPGS